MFLSFLLRATMSRLIKPPAIVKGMTSLDVEKFQTTFTLPCLLVSPKRTSDILGACSPYLLKFRNLKTIFTVREQNDDGEMRAILLNIDLLQKAHISVEQLHQKLTTAYSISENDLLVGERPLKICYENWSLDDIFEAVLPDGVYLSSFAQIGHIIHVNLRPELFPFKYILGQVLLDKIGPCRTVVNKIDKIDSIYRNFELELLAGEAEYVATVRENGCEFRVDFEKVFWNSRLSNEHQRLCDLFQSGDTVYDVFGGVGPFAVPAAKKGCRVLANDLNPDCFRWMQENKRLNKVEDSRLAVHNLDGAEFIRTMVRNDLLDLIHSNNSSIVDDSSNRLIINCHVIMNLPALAVEFLPEFVGLLPKETLMTSSSSLNVRLYCYLFCKESNQAAIDDAKTRVSNQLLSRLPTKSRDDVCEPITATFVRNVAPNKQMMRVDCVLPCGLLIGRNNSDNADNVLTDMLRHCDDGNVLKRRRLDHHQF